MKRTESRIFVVVLPNGLEFTQELTEDFDIETLCKSALRHHKCTTTRANPQKVLCNVFQMVVKDSQLVRMMYADKHLTPDLARMTKDEFDVEMFSVLSSIPVQFRDWVGVQSYEDGHSSGYENVVSVARELVHGLLPCIVEYNKAIGTPA